MKRLAKYENWTKEALIQKIFELEGAGKAALTGTASVSSSPAAKKSKQMDFSKFSTRMVAIKVAYLGWNYYGLAYQKDSKTPTVESHILEAFYKTKCISSMDPSDCDFSRCGRTDRDVSAMEQVINLRLRSNLSVDDQKDPANDHKELDYLKILNSHLPADILGYEICLRPPAGFNSRFSCKWRLYRYYFDPKGLDLAKMRQAAAMLLGEQDFRNFCKIDASKQITNYKRTILGVDIVESNGKCYLHLQGTAFLWNQVRSIMGVLFLVGQGLEQPEVVERLLDIELTPRRPAYEIAWGVPLVLYGCHYDDALEWTKSRYSSDALYNLWHEHLIKQQMASVMLGVVSGSDDRPISANVGRGIGKRSRYVPVFDRPVASTFEEKNEKWRAKKTKPQHS